MSTIPSLGNRQDANGTDGAGDGNGWWPGGAGNASRAVWRVFAGVAEFCLRDSLFRLATFLASREEWVPCLRLNARGAGTGNSGVCLATFNCKTLQVLLGISLPEAAAILGGQAATAPAGPVSTLGMDMFGPQSESSYSGSDFGGYGGGTAGETGAPGESSYGLDR
jgi:hypothetical protein